LKRQEKFAYCKGKAEAAIVPETLVLIYQNMTKCHKREKKILIFTTVKTLKFHIRSRGKINIIASKIIHCVPELMQFKI